MTRLPRPAAAALLVLLPLLGGCLDSGARTPVVSVTNTVPAIAGPVTVELGGETLDFGQLRSGEKRRISYQPKVASGVVVHSPGRSTALDRRIDPADPGTLGNDVNILLTPDGAILDPKKNRAQN
ncbi:hypothetical protein GCM10017783_22160 [Deinococcus piscis]|uniref:Uncharacterized protein n=1 Tax=Deinococcus piscis TaxID=394230 RepID=A0ABQ3KA86_9DEIO|nr:hypothetical protein [Deinococcus piscis]GHG09101.1 hypothetical protein GCM10017783_22160 [Deinococcus piscis]